MMLPAVLHWGKRPGNAERQALVAAAIGDPGADAGDVLDALSPGSTCAQPQRRKDRAGELCADRRAGDGHGRGCRAIRAQRRPAHVGEESSNWRLSGENTKQLPARPDAMA